MKTSKVEKVITAPKDRLGHPLGPFPPGGIFRADNDK